LSSDNLTLLVFMHEALPFLRKIRALTIVQEAVGALKSGLYWVVVVYYWDLELSYKHLVTSEVHHPFVPMYFSLVLLKTLFLSLVPYTSVCCISQKKNLRLTPQKLVLKICLFLHALPLPRLPPVYFFLSGLALVNFLS